MIGKQKKQFYREDQVAKRIGPHSWKTGKFLILEKADIEKCGFGPCFNIAKPIKDFSKARRFSSKEKAQNFVDNTCMLKKDYFDFEILKIRITEKLIELIND